MYFRHTCEILGLERVETGIFGKAKYFRDLQATKLLNA